jgi:hypothetical protein
VEGVIVVDVPLGGIAVAGASFGVQAEGVIVVAAVIVAAFVATPVVVGVVAVVVGVVAVVVGVVAVVVGVLVTAGVGANLTSNITKIKVIANIKIGIIKSPQATISALCILSHTNDETEMSPSTKCSGIFALFPEKISLIIIPTKRAAVIIAGYISFI